MLLLRNRRTSEWIIGSSITMCCGASCRGYVVQSSSVLGITTLQTCSCGSYYDMMIFSSQRGRMVNVDLTNFIAAQVVPEYMPIIRRTIRGTIGGYSCIGDYDMVSLAREFAQTVRVIAEMRLVQHDGQRSEVIVIRILTTDERIQPIRRDSWIYNSRAGINALINVYIRHSEVQSGLKWLIVNDIRKYVTADSPFAGCQYYVSSYQVDNYDVAETDIGEFASVLSDLVDDETAMVIASLSANIF